MPADQGNAALSVTLVTTVGAARARIATEAAVGRIRNLAGAD